MTVTSMHIPVDQEFAAALDAEVPQSRSIDNLTAVQVQLYKALGFAIPQFAHMALIKTKEGKQIWRSQMEGKDAHCLSPHPIDGLTQDELSKLVFNKPYDQMLKMKGQDEFQSLGAIVYPGQDGLYVGAGAIEHYQGVQGSGPPYAGVEIVVFKMPAPHKFEVVAHTCSAWFRCWFTGWRCASRTGICTAGAVEKHIFCTCLVSKTIKSVRSSAA